MRLLLCLSVVVAQVALGYENGSVVKRVSRGEAHGLAALDAGKAGAYGEGFVREGDTFVCENTGRDQKRGVSWSVALNQSEPVPVRASAMALVETAGGGEGADFSLYLDILYMDGSHLWGQQSAFAPDAARGWQRREVLVMPERPIKTVSYHLLFRNRAGKVRFKDARFGQVDADKVVLFDTLVTEPLRLRQGGFLLRDVAADSDIVAMHPDGATLRSGTVAMNSDGMGINLATVATARDGVLFYDVTLKNLTGKDRALTFYYIMPLREDKHLQWCGSFRGSTDISSSRSESMSVNRTGIGANGLLSKYPFAAIIDNGVESSAIGLDPSTPLVYRLGCQPATREFFLACDIGLTPEKPSAHFRFVRFTFPAEDGLRGAFNRYYQIFPEAFETRIKEQGQWMAFEAISKLPDFEDFGFRFKEGIDETAWDDTHGILTFRYTEPMTWWMKLDGEKSIARGIAEAQRLAAAGNASAKAWLTSCFHDERGQPPGRILDTPWCNGVVWSMNGAPGLPGDVTEFKNKWKPDYVQATYGSPRPNDGKGIDGEYIDSSEMYVTDALNFRREHFAAADRPLCYSLETRRVGVFKGMAGFEYVRAMAEVAHKSGRYMMANGTPDRWPWLAPLLDVMGTETNWKRGGKWEPWTDEDLMYRRALCKGKPYCFLMNTDFEKWTYDDTERFMKACLAYGMFPGFFSEDASTKHYFKNPDYYNRDRPLFKKYMPLCKRVAQAGWEPLTEASSENPQVFVERFGEIGKGGCLTVYNPTATEQTTRIQRETFNGVSLPSRDLVSGKTIAWDRSVTEVTLEPYGVMVLSH